MAPADAIKVWQITLDYPDGLWVTSQISLNAQAWESASASSECAIRLKGWFGNTTLALVASIRTPLLFRTQIYFLQRIRYGMVHYENPVNNLSLKHFWHWTKVSFKNKVCPLLGRHVEEACSATSVLVACTGRCDTAQLECLLTVALGHSAGQTHKSLVQ